MSQQNQAEMTKGAETKTAQKRSSKTSKTSSDNSSNKSSGKKEPTQEELLEEVSLQVRDLNESLSSLVGIILKDPKHIPAEVRLEDEDLTVLYDVQMIAGKESLLHLKGRQDLPMALHPQHVQGVLRKFQQVFTAIVGEPLAAALQLHLTRLTMAENPNNPMGMEDRTTFALPSVGRGKEESNTTTDATEFEDTGDDGFITPGIAPKAPL